MDVLAPGIGEMIGGTQREERLDVLDARLDEMRRRPSEHYAWYRDLRRYGTVPHAGFGLGFERTIAYVDRPRQRPRRHPLPPHPRQRAVLGHLVSPMRILPSEPDRNAHQRCTFDCLLWVGRESPSPASCTADRHQELASVARIRAA